MEIRALSYSQEVLEDQLIFVSEETLAEQEWPFSELKSFLEARGFKAELQEVFALPFLSKESGEVRHVLGVGVGKRAELDLEKVRKALSKGLKEAEKLKIEVLTVAPWFFPELDLEDVARALSETALINSYVFDRYLSEKKERQLRAVQLAYAPQQEVSVLQGLKRGQALGQATNLARDLVNEPANVMTPEQLAKEAQKAGAEWGFEVEVLEQEQIAALGMQAFLEVGKASANTPRLIIMRHFGDPDQPEQILGYVGKGLTYDSGGLSIKSATSMPTMKYDMGGAAAVIGAMSAIARENLPLNVVAVVAACENLISGSGYRPGDVINSMAGKTILIDSTDAEGRLTLADALHYIISEEKVHTVVDVATLTGAVMVALGNTTTGVVSNDQKLYERLLQASQQSGERIWQLPAFPEYRELNKTPLADLKNVGGRGAGSVTAALFLEAFVQEKPWIHLDIAGTAFAEKGRDYFAEGATGVGVRLLFHLAESYL